MGDHWRILRRQRADYSLSPGWSGESDPCKLRPQLPRWPASGLVHAAGTLTVDWRMGGEKDQETASLLLPAGEGCDSSEK